MGKDPKRNDTLSEPEPEYDEVTIGTMLQVTPKLQSNSKNIHLSFEYEFSDIAVFQKHKYEEQYSYEIPVITKAAISAAYIAENGQTSLLKAIKVNYYGFHP